MYGKFAEAAGSNDDSQQNLKQLQAQEASVKSQVDALATQEGQEAQLRQSYGVALPGEGEIQLVQKSATSTQAQNNQGNFFVRILKALFVW
jgi:cell division protein FtsB